MTSAATARRAQVRDADRQGERVYVWDVVVRITHWIIVLSIVTLSVTGYYIGKPFFDPRVGPFTMARFKMVHFYSAIVFSCAVLARLIWMFSGTKFAHWDQFIPVTRERWHNMREALLFYLFVHRRAPAYPGHNALAGVTYVFVFGLYILSILTGLALYSVDASVTSYTHSFQALLPVFGGTATARWIHHIILWLLWGFAVHHVFSGLLVSQTERDGTIDSIFSGYKFEREGPEPAPTEPREGSSGE